MNYQDFLKTKQKTLNESGIKISEDKINPLLFDFQRFSVVRALKLGGVVLILRDRLQHAEGHDQIEAKVAPHTRS